SKKSVDWNATVTLLESSLTEAWLWTLACSTTSDMNLASLCVGASYRPPNCLERTFLTCSYLGSSILDMLKSMMKKPHSRVIMSAYEMSQLPSSWPPSSCLASSRRWYLSLASWAALRNFFIAMGSCRLARDAILGKEERIEAFTQRDRVD